MTEPATVVDLVLPLHPTKGDTLDLLRAATCLHSFVATGSDTAVGVYNIVYPPGCAHLVAPLARISPKVRLVDEETIFTTREYAAVYSCNGWRRQQFVKLAANRFCDAPTILTCDADVSAIRRFDPATYRRDGRLLAQPGSQEAAWIEASFRLFGLPQPERVISVTPLLLARDGLEIVQSLLGRGWVERLKDASASGSQWSEYMVYQAALQKTGHFDRLHSFAKDPVLTFGVWTKETEPAAKIARVAASDASLLVYQSIRGDFFEAQQLLAAAGLPNFADVPEHTRADLLAGLIEHRERERQWVARTKGLFGTFHDSDARVLRNDDPSSRATLAVLVRAAKVAEQALGHVSREEILAGIEQRLEADPLISTILAGDEVVAQTRRFLAGADDCPETFLRLLERRGAPSRLLELVTFRLIERGAALKAAELLETRLPHGRIAPATVNRVAGSLVAAKQPVALLPLVRRALKQQPNNAALWHELAKAWKQLGKPRHADHAKAQRDRIKARAA